jgi:hypothetical protein
VKTEEQQEVLALHTVRKGAIAERTATINALRALFAEYGIIVAKGRKNVAELQMSAERLPRRAAVAADVLLDRIRGCDGHIDRLEKELMEFHKQSADSRNLATIPSIGPITATLTRQSGADATLDVMDNLPASLGHDPYCSATWVMHLPIWQMMIGCARADENPASPSVHVLACAQDGSHLISLG